MPFGRYTLLNLQTAFITLSMDMSILVCSTPLKYITLK